MAMTYRRPGVYLEESLLVNPADIAGTVTVACFTGVTAKGPINEPTLCESWSDFVTLFGDFNPIPAPIPTDPNNVTSRITGTIPADLAAMKADPEQGDGKYIGLPFTAGQFVSLPGPPAVTQAHYLVPTEATAKGTAAPGQRFAAEVTVTASDPTNAALLTGLGYVAAPTTAWTTGQNIWVGNYAFFWDGNSWEPGSVGVNEVQTLTPGGTISGGTWTLTVLGVTTASLAHTANAAAIKAAIDTAIPGNTITVTGGPISAGTNVVLTYGGAGTNVAIATVSTTNLTGTNPSVAVATTTSGITGVPNANNGAWTAGVFPGTPPPLPTSMPPVLSYLPFSVYSFFQNGGRFAWIIRSVSNLQKGTPSSVDVNGKVGGDPLQSFTLVSRSVGTWGDKISYQLVTQQVATPPATDDVFALQILVHNSEGVNEVVETWPSLSVKGTLPGTRRVDAVINDPASGSQYVRVVNLNENQAQPTATNIPTFLDGGVDPGVPDGATLVSSSYNVTKLEGPITLNIAGYLNDASAQDGVTASTAWVSATVRGDTFPDRQDIFVINDSAPPRIPGTSSSSYKSTMTSSLGQSPGDSYSASYGPWIIIPHPARVGTTVSVPPGGAVMGMMARIDATIGVFRAPAGVIAGLSNAVGVQTKFTDTELGDLNAQNINVVRSVVGAGICVMGARTRKSYGTDRYISARRTLIYIKEVMRRSTQFAVFENNDQRLWSSLRMSAERVLRPLWEAGGLRGASAAAAYFIRCDDTINTPSVIQSGEVRMEMGVALEYPAEFVIIRVTQFDRGTFTNEVQPTA